MKRLREAGIHVTASLAPVLYCQPRQFAEQIAEAADGVYFGKMDYTDRTGIASMPRARRYFNSLTYRELVTELKAELINVGMLKSEK